jgi:hypothetical protein
MFNQGIVHRRFSPVGLTRANAAVMRALALAAEADARRMTQRIHTRSAAFWKI